MEKEENTSLPTTLNEEPVELVATSRESQEQDAEKQEVIQSSLAAAAAVGEPLDKKASVGSTGTIPNGGLTAWLQVFGSFFLFFNTWGIINTYGALQTYYETDLLKSSTPSAISWVGSVQSFLLLFIGALTGPVYDAGYFRTLLIAGLCLTVFGTMMLSLCTEYWQVLLAQGFCVGMGCGCLFVPSVAILSTYFTTRVALAVGLAASGSSLGGVIYPIMFHKLQPEVGFGWAIRIWGFVILFGLSMPVLVMKMRVKPGATRPMLDLPAFKHLPYTVFNAGSFIGFMGLYAPFFYIQLFDISHSITDPNLVFYLLAIMNSASVFGRIIPNFFADKVGPLNVIIPCAYASGILCLSLMAVHDTAGLVVFCILYGFFSGSFVSLPASVLITLSPNRRLIGTHMGMAFAIVSIGLLIGAPIAGAILNNHGFNSVWIFSGVLTLIGATVMWASRVISVGSKFMMKA